MQLNLRLDRSSSMSLLMYIFRIGSLDINTRYVIITIYFLLTA